MTGDDVRPGVPGSPDDDRVVDGDATDGDVVADDVAADGLPEDGRATGSEALRYLDVVPDDGPVIDPRDPLGLGDLPLPEDPADADPLHAATARDLAAARVPGHDESDEPASDGAHPDDTAPDDRIAGATVPGATVPDDAAPDDAARDGGSTDVPAPAGEGLDDDHGTPAPSVVDGAVPDHEASASVAGAATAGAANDSPGAAPRSGWSRLAHAMRPRTTQGQLITAALCALLGFALVVQVRQTSDTQLGSLRQNDLVRLLDETTTRTDELEQESLDLQRERDELLSGSDRQQAALDAARRTAAMQGILTGRLPATGPGVRITLTEPDGEIRPATMVHVLEELRNAGAEAMELNDHRITASSAFTGARGAVELDGTVLQSPFRWTVIGDPDTIAPALEIPGGALVRVRLDGGRGTVEKSDQVEVQATRVLTDPVHASPAPDAG